MTFFLYSRRRRLLFGRADEQQTSRVHTNRTEMRPEQQEKKICSIGGNVKHGIGKLKENNLFAKKKLFAESGRNACF